MEAATFKILVFLAATISGCVSLPKLYNPPPPPKEPHSRDVVLEFEAIEREEALNKYRRIRWEKWGNYIRSSKPKKKIVRRKKIKTRPPPPSPPAALSTPKLSRIKVEIDQNLTYFCMKNRKKSAYRVLSKCNTYTQNTLNQCSSANGHRLNRKVLSCIKRKLRLR